MNRQIRETVGQYKNGSHPSFLFSRCNSFILTVPLPLGLCRKYREEKSHLRGGTRKFNPVLALLGQLIQKLLSERLDLK